MNIKPLLERKHFLYLAVFWTIIVLVLSLVSFRNIKFPSVSEGDKIAHFVFYSGFVFLWNQAIQKENKKSIIFIIAIVFGIIIEVLQEKCTQTRSFDVKDIVANSFGAMIGWLFTTLYQQFLHKK